MKKSLSYPTAVILNLFQDPFLVIDHPDPDVAWALKQVQGDEGKHACAQVHHNRIKLARLFFCMSLDPPTIGMPSR
ncbi:MAG: hypothetical protein ACT6R2_18600, partial [Blastomonas fulva]|uniref:hypothetical protein n=1 Tax=Blastomonas fulva TaxID=1550728 RepID=UPI0040339027